MNDTTDLHNLRNLKGDHMNTDNLLDEIRETNLAYLMLAQHMIRKDRIPMIGWRDSPTYLPLLF